MKREIKFRGKDLNGEGWVYGSYLLTDDNENSPCISSRRIKQRHQIVQYNAGDWGMGQWVYYDVDPESIGQYTGLKDKNGEEIYEGDIIEHHRDGKDVVSYGIQNVDAFEGIGFNLWDFYGECSDIGKAIRLQSSIEIIGNIHDKNKQKQALIDMIRGDEEIGLYDDNPKN